MKEKSIVSAAFGALLVAVSGMTPIAAQVLQPQCGNEGESACHIWTAEFWANDSGTCDRGLEELDR